MLEELSNVELGRLALGSCEVGREWGCRLTAAPIWEFASHLERRPVALLELRLNVCRGKIERHACGRFESVWGEFAIEQEQWELIIRRNEREIVGRICFAGGWYNRTAKLYAEPDAHFGEINSNFLPVLPWRSPTLSIQNKSASPVVTWANAGYEPSGDACKLDLSWMSRTRFLSLSSAGRMMKAALGVSVMNANSGALWRWAPRGETRLFPGAVDLGNNLLPAQKLVTIIGAVLTKTLNT